jgi:hypothetical protein
MTAGTRQHRVAWLLPRTASLQAMPGLTPVAGSSWRWPLIPDQSPWSEQSRTTPCPGTILACAGAGDRSGVYSSYGFGLGFGLPEATAWC